MAQGDRVVVGTGYLWEHRNQDGEVEHVMVYSPVLNEQGGPVVTPDGSTVVEKQGGVVAGSTGTIDGPVVNVHRSYLHNAQPTAGGLGGSDLVQLVPVFLDVYQKRGWFPVDNIRIFEGSPSES
jgi:hypothetical protein